METDWVYHLLFQNKNVQHIWVYAVQWQFPNASSGYHLFRGCRNLRHRIACCKRGTLTAVLVTSGARKVGAQSETVGTVYPCHQKLWNAFVGITFLYWYGDFWRPVCHL